MAAALRPVFARVWLTRYPGPRAAAPAALRQHFPEARVESDPQRALARAREERPPGGLVVVAGSLYLLAALARTASEAGAQ